MTQAPPHIAPGLPGITPPADDDAHQNNHPAHGSGEITFTRVGNSGHTAITHSSATSPLRILAPKPAGPSAWAFTSNFGGGLVSGDHLSLHITANPHTTCYLSTQSSTKIFRSTHNQLTQQSLHADIHDHALLISTPDPVVSFAGSRYRQTQTFHLAPTASLLLLDWFTSGRHACDERWQLHALHSRNEIFIDHRRLLLDNLRLDENDGPLNGPFRTANFNSFATLILLGPRLAPFADPLLHLLRTAPIQRTPSLLYGISPLADGLILRLAGANAEEAGRFLYNHLQFLATLLGEHPWLRKW